jgi:hypothetical protein
VRLGVGWRATELFGVNDPDLLIRDDDEPPDPDGLGLFLRICLLLFLGLIFWQAMLVTLDALIDRSTEPD